MIESECLYVLKHTGGYLMVPKILRRNQLEANLGISRSTIYQMMASGEFPKPLKIGRRAVGWRAEDIEKWLDNMQEVSHD